MAFRNRNPDFDVAKARLVQRLRQEITDDEVLNAMSRVPRHLFVPVDLRHEAYEDYPLPIGDGQTISQPFIVALMTQSLKITKDHVVLEIGTGSGYQTAILAELAGSVVSVERISDLAIRARELLSMMGYQNLEVHEAGIALGYQEKAPFDRIIVTAAAPLVPQVLLDQLKDGGRMILPVGSRHDQELVAVTKRGDEITREYLVACRFVPLLGEDAWNDSY